MILFLNQQQHVGGGQTVINAYQKMLTKHGLKFEYRVGINADLIRQVIIGRYSSAIVNIYDETYLPFLLLLKLKGVAIIFPNFGFWFLERHELIGFRAKCERYLQHMIFWCTSKIIVFSKYAQKILASHFGSQAKKVVIIPGAVDRKRFRPVSIAQKKKLRQKLQIPSSATVYLIASRLDTRKKIAVAIEAFQLATKNDEKAVLYIIFPIIGYTSLEILHDLFELVAKLKIGPKVHFLTAISDRELTEYLQAGDIFIMSSTANELFGLTVLEALASGMLPISFETAAMPEFLSLVSKKLSAKPFHARGLARSLKWANSLSMNEKSQLLQTGQRVADLYSWELREQDFITLMKHFEKKGNLSAKYQVLSTSSDQGITKPA